MFTRRRQTAGAGFTALDTRATVRPLFARQPRPLIFLCLLALLTSTALTSTALTSSTTAPPGVILETINEGTALAVAGLQPGDQIAGWVRGAAQGTSPHAGPAPLDSPFDWTWLVHEQAPRGIVHLHGTHQGQPKRWTVSAGDWASTVLPVFTEPATKWFHEAQESRQKGDHEGESAALRQLAAHLEQSGADDLQSWVQLRLGVALAAADHKSEALTAHRKAVEIATSATARVYSTKALALFYWRTNDLRQTEATLRAASALCEGSWGTSLAGAEALNHLGFFLNLLDRSEEAGQILERAKAITGELAPDSLSHANSLSNLGMVFNGRGELNAADELLTKAASIMARRAPGSSRLASVSLNLGVVKRNRGDLAGAEAAYRIALTIDETLNPGSNYAATTLTNLSEVINELGRGEEAGELLEQALSIRQRRSPGSLDHAITLNNLGETFLQRGDLASAEHYLLQARDLLQHIGPRTTHMGACLGTLAMVEHQRGDLNAATELTQQALNIFHDLAPTGYQVATARTALGALAAQAGDLQQAQHHLRQALAIFEQTERDSEIDSVHLLLQLSALARKGHQFNEAKSYLQRVHAILSTESIGGSRAADLASQRAELALATGDLDEAVTQFRVATKLWSQIAPESTGSAEALAQLGTALHRRGKTEEAARTLLAALDILDRQIDRLGATSTIEALFRAQRAPAYLETIDTLLELQRPQEAFHVAERGRSRVLLNLLAQRELRFDLDLPPELDRNRRRNAALYDRALARLAHGEDLDSSVRQQLRHQLDQLRKEREQIALAVRRASPRLSALADPQPLNASAAIETLEPGTVVLYYCVGPRATTLFLLTPGKPMHTVRIEVSEESLREQVHALLDAVQRSAGSSHWRQPSQSLFSLLISPASEWIEEGQRLLIVPDGPLHRLPFAALLQPTSDGRSSRFLVEWKPIHSVVSLTVYQQLRQPPTAMLEPPLLVAFADPRPPNFAAGSLASATRAGLGSEWRPLPYARREVERIARLFPTSRTFFGADATEARAKQLPSSGHWVHFATHGYLDAERPLDSGLILSASHDSPQGLAPNPDNGLLQAWEIFEQVRLNADLVVLSACDTALGEELAGEGLIGLTRAFHFAGARTVAATLWSVADQPTGELMVRFYQHMRDGSSTDAALRQAQLDLIHSPIEITVGGGNSVEMDASAPYFWAGFQLYGDWR